MLRLHTPARAGDVAGVRREAGPQGTTQLKVKFDGPEGEYVRREVTVPLARR